MYNVPANSTIFSWAYCCFKGTCHLSWSLIQVKALSKMDTIDSCVNYTTDHKNDPSLNPIFLWEVNDNAE
jgi:hypothetical protein